MSSNVCGNCANFKPAKDAKFFDCTFAQQGGVKYAMQVRPDTRSCEAFAPLKPSPKPQAVVKPPAATPKRVEPQRGALCNWGRIIMVAALIIIILLIAFGAYTCFKGGSPAPTPTPTPQPTQPPSPPPIIIITPTPIPTPTPITKINSNLGTWASTTPWMIVASAAEKTTKYNTPGPVRAPANMVFIFVTVTVVNTGNVAWGLSTGDFYLNDNLGGTYRPQELSMHFYNAFPWGRFVVGPGKTVSGKLLYTVPDVSLGLEIITFQNGRYLAWSLGF